MKIEGFVYPENIVMVNASNDSDSVSFEEGQVLNARVCPVKSQWRCLKPKLGTFFVQSSMQESLWKRAL